MALSDEKIILRFTSISSSVQSIETVSLWVLHHCGSAARFISCWLEAFKSASEEKQIALFYLANDVCQRSKRNVRYDNVLQTFASYFVTAIWLSRNSEAVQKAVCRILHIFEERRIYTRSLISEMRAAQNKVVDGNTHVSGEDTQDFIVKIEDYIRSYRLLKCARRLFMKGLEFQAQVGSASNKLVELIDMSIRCGNKAEILIDMLSTVYWSNKTKLMGATVSYDNYMKLALRMIEVGEKVKQMIKFGGFAAASPPHNVLSLITSQHVGHAYESVRQIFKSTR